MSVHVFPLASVDLVVYRSEEERAYYAALNLREGTPFLSYREAVRQRAFAGKHVLGEPSLARSVEARMVTELQFEHDTGLFEPDALAHLVTYKVTRTEVDTYSVTEVDRTP